MVFLVIFSQFLAITDTASAALSTSVLVTQEQSSWEADPRDDDVPILPFETGWIRHIEGRADDDSPTCLAQAEGSAFGRLAIQYCPPNSSAASVEQLGKTQRLLMESISAVTLAGHLPVSPPALEFRQLSSGEVELHVAADGSVLSCQPISGSTATELCGEFERGEMRFTASATGEDHRGRFVQLSGLCHALDKNSCGAEEN